uniref:Uncharacterized protein n=1 Tax=uncultured bacterium contig00030 TaxID=1181519 RepID=A0A806KIS4_9BACT|nr:hypothetical protein [uncultured bacterium contig00030]
METKYRSPALWILALSFFISMVTLGVYLTENDFSDETLFFLLFILRYSSFVVCICSVYLLIDSIICFVRRSSVLFVIRIIVSFFCVLYGVGIIIMDAFINSITRGME